MPCPLSGGRRKGGLEVLRLLTQQSSAHHIIGELAKQVRADPTPMPVAVVIDGCEGRVVRKHPTRSEPMHPKAY